MIAKTAIFSWLMCLATLFYATSSFISMNKVIPFKQTTWLTTVTEVNSSYLQEKEKSKNIKKYFCQIGDRVDENCSILDIDSIDSSVLNSNELLQINKLKEDLNFQKNDWALIRFNESILSLLDYDENTTMLIKSKNSPENNFAKLKFNFDLNNNVGKIKEFIATTSQFNVKFNDFCKLGDSNESVNCKVESITNESKKYKITLDKGLNLLELNFSTIKINKNIFDIKEKLITNQNKKTIIC